MNYQVVIITGAASGMGAAIAVGFAKRDASLCIADINEKDLHKTREECQKLSKNRVRQVTADLRKEEDLDNIIKCTLQEFGKIDVLVNCAGIFESTNLQDSNIIDKFDKFIAINLRSVVALTNKALPALIANKGCVINISSISSTIVTSNAVMYCMTKAAVKTFTKCAAFELAGLGVRVNSIAPGPVKTNILINAGVTEMENNEFWASLPEVIPLKKCVKPEEIAELAVYLASDKAASITGTEFVIDAGMMLGTAGFGKKENEINE